MSSIQGLTTKELVDRLREHKLDNESLENLRSIILILLYCFGLSSAPILHAENDIDGELLVELVSDLEEFQRVVSKSGSRLRIKSFIRSAKQVCINITELIRAITGAFNKSASEGTNFRKCDHY